MVQHRTEQGFIIRSFRTRFGQWEESTPYNTSQSKQTAVRPFYLKLSAISAPAWMFHGTIVAGNKGPVVFWEKEWGNMKPSTYDTYILADIEVFLQVNPDYIWMQDSASSHRSKETQGNLQRRGIRSIQWPRYSPDLNLIEHVWNWMKIIFRRDTGRHTTRLQKFH